MNDQDTELAREIAEDLFTPKYLENALGKHTLDAFKSCFIRTVEQALHSVRQEENEACYKIALRGICMDTATAIRSRLKSQGEAKEKGEGRG